MLLASVAALPALYAVSALPEASQLADFRNMLRQSAATPVSTGLDSPNGLPSVASVETVSLEPGYDAMAIEASPISGVAVEPSVPVVDVPGLEYQTLQGIELTLGGKEQTRKQSPAHAPGKIVVGEFISRDLSANGSQLGSLISVENYGSSADTVLVGNLYQWGKDVKVKMAVNAAAGTVAIPQQTLEVHQTYGKIDVVAISISADGKYSVPQDRTIRGTINENGEATLGPWAIIALDEATKKVKATFNIFDNSRWGVPNGSLGGVDMETKEVKRYPILIEQSLPNEAIIYNMIDGLTASLSARLTAAGKVMLSPQQVLTNSIYGAFYIYGINPTNGKPDTTNPIVVTPASDGSLSFSGFYVADQQTTSMVLTGMNTVKITGTYDITFPTAEAVNFKGSGTASDPWQIASYSNLKALSQSVEGGNTYAGKFFKLTADLDLSNIPVTEYVPIGNATDQFLGVFDGDNHTIKGLRIDGKGFPYVGIFGYLGAGSTVKNLVVDGFMAIGSGSEIGCVTGRCEGTIDNVEVKNSVLQTSGLLTGGICGAMLNGKVTNCRVHGKFTGMGSVAGIAGQASQSEITGCSVRGLFTIDGFVSEKARDMGGLAGVFSLGTIKDCMVSGTMTDTYGRSATGGLVGRVLSGATVSNCMNTASISGRRYSSNTASYAGGLFGLCVSAVVNDCFNSGTIIMSGDNDNVGGLAGQLSIAYVHSGSTVYMSQQSYFTNCYTSGQITSSSTAGSKGLYGYAFYEEGYKDHPEDICFINCFFDQQINKFENKKFGRLTSEITGKIPTGFDSSKWTVSTNKYPVLSKFVSTQAGELASVPVILRSGHTASKVKQSFALGSSANVAWSLDGEAGNTENEALKITGSAVTVKDKYASAIIGASTADGMGLKVYVLDVVPKVFDGDGTESSPYLIKTPADFIQLHEAVGTHSQAHAGDYFRMTSDIDFASSPSFKGVGNGTMLSTGFGGVFDGDGHAIHNLKLKMATYTGSGDYDPSCPNGYNGLFNQLLSTGVIRNLTLASDCQFDFNIFSAPVVAFNRGLVENCRNYADVIGHERQIGGIVGVNYSGTISNCYNAGRVISGNQVAGGISAYNFEEGIIRQCQNDGFVAVQTTAPYNSKLAHNSAGGITSDNYGIVEDCVNNGEVSSASIVGGIAAYVVASYVTQDPNNPMKAISHDCWGIVRRCVNNAQISCESNSTLRGAIIGQRNSTKEISSNYYDGSINLFGGMQNNDVEGTKALSTGELVEGKALAGLNAEIFDFSANAYPVLKAFVKEESTKALRSIFVKFEPGTIRTNILKPVDLSSADGLTWKLENNSGFSISGSKLNVVVPTGTTILSDTLTASLGTQFVKTYAINSVPVIFSGGGTESDPYRIESKEDWKKLADFIESTGWEYNYSHFILTRDLDFGGDSIRIVAHSGNRFQGNFNGNGKTLSNFIYDNPNGFENSIEKNPDNPNKFVAKSTGLFGAVGNAGTVRNLTIDGIVRGHSDIGGIAGAVYGTIDNCIVKGLVGTNSSTAVGGVAYRLYDGGVIRNCTLLGKVLPDNGSGGGQTGAAGIVYFTNESSLVENCVNRGTVGHPDKGGAAGIVYTCMGNLRDCVNEKELQGPSNLYGVVYSVSKNAILENCSNTADFNKNVSTGGANIFGVFGTFAGGGTGYAKGCFNTGNITAVNFCGGVGNTANVPLIDCWNSGNITSVKNGAYGVVKSIAGTTDQRVVASGLYNTGKIESAYMETAGVVSDLKEYVTLTDSYNLGTIIQRHKGLCCGGVVAHGYGRIERCFNAGDVYSWGHCTGGVVGRPGSNKADFEAGVYDCFNLGNVTVESQHSGTTLYGAVGGVIGSPINGALDIARCHNSGTVSLRNTSCVNPALWAGGVIGGVLNGKTTVSDCYNTGRVIKLDPTDSSLHVAMTIGTPTEKFKLNTDSVAFYSLFSRIYYDKMINTGTDERLIPGSALPSSKIAALELEGFSTSSHGGYPHNSAFAQNHQAAGLSTAMLLLGNEANESHDGIITRFGLLAPEDCEWKEEPASDGQARLWLSGGYGYPLASGATTLLCTSPDGMVRRFPIVVSPNFKQDGVEDVLNGRTIESVTYIDLQGRRVAYPQAGEVYIVTTRYTDGTIDVRKVMAHN